MGAITPEVLRPIDDDIGDTWVLGPVGIKCASLCTYIYNSYFGVGSIPSSNRFVIVIRLIGGVMSTAITGSHIGRNLEGQTVVVIGGSAGIGLETARRASVEGAKLILTGRSPARLRRAASEVHALL